MHSSSLVDLDAFARAFWRDGYYVCEGVLDHQAVNRLRLAVAAVAHADAVRKRKSVYGVRNLLELCPAVCELARQPPVRQFAVAALGEQAFAVRAILFDKVPDANWSLFWHQDNVVAVKERVAAPELVGWSQKAGVWQVQPPAEVLAKMIAVRVHLDDCSPDNGPLRVIPGSHRCGWIEENLDDWKSRVPEVVCSVGCGGVVAMSPLVLHASGPAQAPAHRRVIHIEFAADELPFGLEWKHRMGPA